MLRTTATAISASLACRCVTAPIAGMDRWFASKRSCHGPCHADRRSLHYEPKLSCIHRRFSVGISKRLPPLCLFTEFLGDGGAPLRKLIHDRYAKVAQTSVAHQPCTTRLPASSDPCTASACAADSIPIARRQLRWRLSPTGSLAYRSRNGRPALFQLSSPRPPG